MKTFVTLPKNSVFPTFFTDENVALAESLGVKSGAVMWCVRVAAAGLAVTPGGATEIMEILGKEETMARIEKAFEKIA